MWREENNTARNKQHQQRNATQRTPNTIHTTNNSTSQDTSPTASGKGLRRLAQCVWMAGCDCGVVVFFWIQLWCGTRFGENSYCRFILWPYKIIANRSWMMMHRTEMGISLLLLLPDDYLPPLLQPPASHLLRTIFNQWEINVIFHNIILWLKVYHHYSC